MPYEIFLKIEGYDNYSVSNLSKVRNDKRNKIIRPWIKDNGYANVELFKDGEGKEFRVHKLVINTFKANSDNKSDIDHINGIKTDNALNNLRYCTHRENMNNPVTLQKMKSKGAK